MQKGKQKKLDHPDHFHHNQPASVAALRSLIGIRRNADRLPSGTLIDFTRIRKELREHPNPLLNEKLVLAAWLRERGDGDGSVFLFTSRQGSRLKRRQIYNLFRKCVELAGLDGPDGLLRLGPHQLKHAYASHLLRNGADLAFVQKSLGHAHISSTTRYTHVSTSEAQMVSNRILGSVFATS